MKKFFIVFIVLIMLFGGAYYGYKTYTASLADDFSDAKGLFYLIGSLETSETPLVMFQKEQLDQGLVYITLSQLESHFKVYGDYDREMKRLRLFKNGQRVEMDEATGDIFIGNESFELKPLVQLEGELYVPINGLEPFLGISIIDNKTLSSVMVVENNSGYPLVDNYEGYIFYRDWSLTKERYSKPEGGLIPIEEHEGAVKLLSSKLIPYYASREIEERIQFKPIESLKTNLTFREGEKIYMFWEYVGSKHPNTEDIGDLSGANLSSPTWMALATGEGDIQLNYSESYITWAKSRNIEVWPIVTNGFDPDMTSVLLNSMKNRDAFIDQLLTFLEDKNLKGVNIDFENIHLRDQDQFTQFMAELVYAAHGKGIIVSIDVTVPDGSDNWSLVFDRLRLGDIVDYVMVMTYDQYWASSPISGTVAGITWVESNIKKMMALVPQEKLVLGIPLYTRVWTETLSTTTANAMDTKSKAITMNRTQEIIAEKKLTPIWDEENGQYFVSYFNGETIVKIWIEDLKSLELKASLAKKYELAGVACWRRGFELSDAWSVIDKAMKGE